MSNQLVKIHRELLGFSLLELLLVLVCMAAIISWSMQHYQLKQRRTQTLQIESDIKSLQRALDIYFHAMGCRQNGEFAVPPGNINCQTLQKYGNVACNRPPLVAQYSASVIDTGQTNQDFTPKPLYHLGIQATMAAKLTKSQLSWFQKVLAAKDNSTDATLSWESLPTNSFVQTGDNAWILNGAGAYFRDSQNQSGANGADMPEFSGSFCAN